MGWSPEGRIIKNCQVVNNTTFGNAKDRLGEIAIYSTENTTIKNNIFYSTHANSNLLYVDDSHLNLDIILIIIIPVLPMLSFTGRVAYFQLSNNINRTQAVI